MYKWMYCKWCAWLSTAVFLSPRHGQAQTYAHIRKGKDLIGRARTGMGKTLAFAVPVIEKLLASGAALKRGRAPRVLVMAPTRELAKQVGAPTEMCAKLSSRETG